MRTFVTLFGAMLVSIFAYAQNQGDSMKNSSSNRTVCLGRFLVDIPKDAEITANPAEYRADKISTTRRISQEAFRHLIFEREKTLGETKHKTDVSLLKHVSKSEDGNSVFLVFWETPATKALYDTEAYKWTHGSQFLIRSHSSPNKLPTATETANRSLAELRYRGDSEIPTEPGFCIDGGFFAGEPEGTHYENSSLRFRLKQHQDVTVAISTSTVMKEGREKLLARVDRKPTPDLLKPLAAQIKTLRRGERVVGGIEGEELLEALPLGDTFFTHSFTWESAGKPKQLYAPSIVVQMDTGETPGSSITRPSLNDKQAIELFDSIVNSIRIRPVNARPSSPHQPPAPSRPQAAVPLGTSVSSLQPCPQTGVWQCTAQLAAGERRRFFPQGMVLPTVIVRGPKRSMWQKVKGAPPNSLVETTWTLVSYDIPKPDEPGRS